MKQLLWLGLYLSDTYEPVSIILMTVLVGETLALVTRMISCHLRTGQVTSSSTSYFLIALRDGVRDHSFQPVLGSLSYLFS